MIHVPWYSSHFAQTSEGDGLRKPVPNIAVLRKGIANDCEHISKSYSSFKWHFLAKNRSLSKTVLRGCCLKVELRHLKTTLKFSICKKLTLTTNKVDDHMEKKNIISSYRVMRGASSGWHIGAAYPRTAKDVNKLKGF